MSITEDILKHAEEESPKESCGLVIVFRGIEEYIPCRNISDYPEDYFDLHPEDYADAEDRGEVVAIVHSHPNSEPFPSLGDVDNLERSGLPWIIVNPNTGGYSRTNPKDYSPPLTGRKYVYGSDDCFTVVQDYYKDNLEIILPNVIRTTDPAKNNILNHFISVGFKKVENIEKHDLIVMQCGGSFPSHLGVYLGDGYILHHAVNKLSSRDVYGNAGYWYQSTWGYLRHIDLF